MNYDPSQVGLPYVRVTRLTIDWPDSVGEPQPTASVEQSLAVKLLDGSIRTLDILPTLGVKLDFTNGDIPIPLVVDHCHTTSKVRGLICSACNSVLGYSRDNIKTLENAITYLKDFYE